MTPPHVVGGGGKDDTAAAAAALVIDHYGLLGVTRLAATPQRLLGLALVAAGVAVFRL